MLKIETKQLQPDVVVLEIAGKITLGTESKQLEWAVDSLVGEGQKKVIFDLAGVTNLDSTGIGILVMSSAKLRKAERSATVGLRHRARGISIKDDKHRSDRRAWHPTVEAAAGGF